ncbi:MAG: TrkH family potassium uptake protein, partial [Negativicutes bacterium]|nr:TrkH family potassium uptake protein [Negativicutes bacterium]
MRSQIVVGLLGKMLIAFALFMVVPLCYAVFQREAAGLAFLNSMVATGLFGLALFYGGQTAGHVGTREGFLIVAGTWVFTSAFGALPYYFSGWVPTYLDAVFETVSGLTTTGA